jgi:hypothetical protein
MAKIVPIQTAFNQGQLGPSMDGRVDLPEYSKGCKRLENFVVRPQGGVTARSGLKFIAEAKKDENTRLIPFDISNVDSYMLEVGDEYMRFYKDGAQLELTEGPNLVSNPGFETGDFTGWTQNSSTIDTTTPQTGTYASKLVASGTATFSGAESAMITVDPTKVYRAVGNVNVTILSGGTHRLQALFYDSGMSLISGAALKNWTAVTSGYETITKTIGPAAETTDFDFPTNTAFMTLKVISIVSGSNITAFFDNASINLLSVQGPNLLTNPGFETGDFTGWEGASPIKATISNLIKHSGVYSAKHATSTSQEVGAESDQIAVDVTKIYKASGWFFRNGGLAGTYTAGINFYNAAGTPLGITIPIRNITSADPLTTWTFFSATIGPSGDADIAFPNNTVTISIDMEYKGPGSAANMQFDDFFFGLVTAPIEISTPYTSDEVMQLDYAQTNDVMYFSHPNHAPTKLSRIADDEWLLTTVNFQTEPTTIDRFTIDDPTSITQLPTPEAFAENKTAQFSDTDNTNFTFIDGDIGRVLFAGSRSATILWTETGSVTQEVFGKIIDKFLDSDTTLSIAELSMSGTPFGEITPSGVGAVGDVITIDSSQNGKTAEKLLGSWVASGVGSQYYWNVNPTTEPDEVAWHGDFLKKDSAGLGAGLGIDQWGYGDVDTLGFNTIYIRTRLDTDPEDLVDSQDENAILRVDDTGSLAQLFRKADEGKFILVHDGIIEITTFVDATKVRGRIIKAITAATATFDWTLESSYWKDSDYPAAIVFHENRLVYGGSPSFPSTFWGSSIDDYESFTTGTNDGDSYTFTLQARRGTQIRWLESRDILIAGLEDAEWAIGTRDSIVTPTSILTRKQTEHGSENIQPSVVEKSIVFIEKGGKKLREINFDFETDSYLSQDMTILSDNITDDGTVDMASQKRPIPVVWITTDQSLRGMTYIKTQGIIAWHAHGTGVDGSGDYDDSDSIKAVGVLRSHVDDTAEELWCVVSRAGGRYIELMQPPLSDSSSNTDARQLDSYILDTNLSTSVSGLDHLEGEVVTAIIDGDPDKIETHTVSSGAITLTETPTINVVVGLKYTPLVQTMRINVPGPLGTSQAQTKRIGDIYFRLLNSLGVKCGPEEDNLVPLEGVNDGTAPAGSLSNGLFTGDVEFQDYKGGNDSDGFVFIVQEDPLPVTVTAIVTKVNTTGGDE